MPIVKAVNNIYGNKNDLKNLVAYAIKPSKCREGVYGAQGVLKSNAENMWRQMQDIKEYYRKTERKQAYHYIVSFDKEEMLHIGLKESLEIGYKVCGFFHGFQAVFGVHTNEENLHIHLILNPVSYINGKKYTMNKSGLSDLKRHVNNVVMEYIPDE